ncbi:cache domain-containing protein [Bradyrhizobium diazoefficiens]|nr:cache domain-containing protein [Bradyrhizobium diazoefficiens]MBR0778531.1 cache domain-containing protein [Bradyrhizobium diazoefficiens]MBR0851402.1 cache domain-containing protein [Bradyrhizobium diazoefficiens]
MKRLAALVLSLVMFAATAPIQAANNASPDEAKAMALKAADYLKANGPEKSFALFQTKDEPTFHDRDLYVYVLDNGGKVLSHGVSAPLIGKPLIELRDVDGKAFIQDVVAVKESDWVSYKWQNPVSKAVEKKTAFIVRVGETVVVVGAYAN